MRTRPWTAAAGRAALLLAGLLASGVEAAASQGLPPSSLSVWSGGQWREFWRAERAPSRWTGAHREMDRALRWRTAAPGVEWSEISLAGAGAAWRIGVVLVRVSPERVDLRLAEARREGGTLGAWTVDSVPGEALLALNAGQFRGGRPWGWLVRDGREHQAPGTGALGMALVVDGAGTPRLVEPDSIAEVRGRGGVAQAFQSYPMLLSGDGRVPFHLQSPDRGVDVEHRDSRLAIGQLHDGRLLIALTRWEGFGGMLDALPFGPTAPEMAGLMGALGCRSAMLLDGGLSGQLLLRDSGGKALTWPGMRRVPLGLVVRSRG